MSMHDTCKSLATSIECETPCHFNGSSSSTKLNFLELMALAISGQVKHDPWSTLNICLLIWQCPHLYPIKQASVMITFFVEQSNETDAARSSQSAINSSEGKQRMRFMKSRRAGFFCYQWRFTTSIWRRPKKWTCQEIWTLFLIHSQVSSFVKHSFCSLTYFYEYFCLTLQQ